MLYGEFIIITVVVVVVVVVEGRNSSLSVLTKLQDVRPLYRDLIHRVPEIFPFHSLYTFFGLLSALHLMSLFCFY
jgi:hypothetical protein